MRKHQFVQRLARRLLCRPRTAERWLRAFVNEIRLSVRQGDPVVLYGFGSFRAVRTRAKRIRDPQGKWHERPAGWKLRFRPTQSFKDVL